MNLGQVPCGGSGREEWEDRQLTAIGNFNDDDLWVRIISVITDDTHDT